MTCSRNTFFLECDSQNTFLTTAVCQVYNYLCHIACLKLTLMCSVRANIQVHFSPALYCYTGNYPHIQIYLQDIKHHFYLAWDFSMWEIHRESCLTHWIHYFLRSLWERLISTMHIEESVFLFCSSECIILLRHFKDLGCSANIYLRCD